MYKKNKNVSNRSVTMYQCYKRQSKSQQNRLIKVIDLGSLFTADDDDLLVIN